MASSLWIVLLSATLAALSTALTTLPWAAAAGVLVETALLLVPAVGICSVLHFVVRAPLERRPELARTSARVFAVIALFTLLYTVLAVAANVLLVDEPLKSRKLVCYALAFPIAGLAVFGAMRRNWASRLRERVRSAAPQQLGRWLALAAGVFCGIADGAVFPHSYTRVHYAFFAATLVSFCVAGYLWAAFAGARRALAFAGFAAAALGAATALDGDTTASVYETMWRSKTSQAHVLGFARRLLDRDGDGHAALLGGGDCDDSDPRAHPLSWHGRDCLGFAQPNAPAAAAIDVRSSRATRGAVSPKVIVLITVDALRCGFGVAEWNPLLLDACPALTRLARSGRSKLDVHTNYPRTTIAMLGIHSGSAALEPQPTFVLPQWMRANGYTTRAISGHPGQFTPALRTAFDNIDRSVERAAAPPSASTALLATERTLAAVRTHLAATAPPLFLWVHYFDPHSPYVDPPGSPWALSSNVARFAAEVRRTDAAIGRLADALAELPSTDVLLLLTADHGEEFDEQHRGRTATHHAHSLNEPALRVPVVVWSPNAGVVDALPKDLPASLSEVAPFLIAAAGGPEFSSRGEAFSWVLTATDRQLGIYRGGWKLVVEERASLVSLFDLRSDPFETNNLAEQNPKLRGELGRRLASYIRPGIGSRTREERRSMGE